MVFFEPARGGLCFWRKVVCLYLQGWLLFSAYLQRERERGWDSAPRDSVNNWGLYVLDTTGLFCMSVVFNKTVRLLLMFYYYMVG